VVRRSPARLVLFRRVVLAAVLDVLRRALPDDRVEEARDRAPLEDPEARFVERRRAPPPLGVLPLLSDVIVIPRGLRSPKPLDLTTSVQRLRWFRALAAGVRDRPRNQIAGRLKTPGNQN
jgi:hypothetical protein